MEHSVLLVRAAGEASASGTVADALVEDLRCAGYRVVLGREEGSIPRATVVLYEPGFEVTGLMGLAGGSLVRPFIVACVGDMCARVMANLMAEGCSGVVHASLGPAALESAIEAAARGLYVFSHHGLLGRSDRWDDAGAQMEQPLLPEELRLLGLLVDGHSVGECAALLHLSQRTAYRRLHSLLTKLDVDCKAQAVSVGMRLLARAP